MEAKGSSQDISSVQSHRNPFREVIHTVQLELEKSSFLGVLEHRGLLETAQHPDRPIRLHDAQAFAKWIQGENPPSGFLESLAENLNYVTTEQFNHGLMEMAAEIKRTIGDRPYDAVVHKDGSQTFLLDLLIKGQTVDIREGYGPIQPPEHIFYTSTAPTENHLTNHLFQAPETARNNGEPLVIVDDISYSGHQLYAMLRTIKQASPNRPVYIFLAGITNQAKAWLEGQLPEVHIYANRSIPTIAEALSPEQAAFLKEINDSVAPEHWHTMDAGPSFQGRNLQIQSTTLTFLPWKLPDEKSLPDMLARDCYKQLGEGAKVPTLLHKVMPRPYEREYQ